MVNAALERRLPPAERSTPLDGSVQDAGRSNLAHLSILTFGTFVGDFFNTNQGLCATSW